MTDVLPAVDEDLRLPQLGRSVDDGQASDDGDSGSTGDEGRGSKGGVAPGEGGSDGEGSSGDEGDGLSERARKRHNKPGFVAGAKSGSFAKAFAKILSSAKGSAEGAVPILSESKAVAKRKAEEAADEKTAGDAKRLRQEIRQRGHMAVPVKGTEPEADARDKALQRVATRGVVALFNAVATAQNMNRDKQLAGLKGKAAVSKAAFFQQLKGQKALVASAAPGQLRADAAQRATQRPGDGEGDVESEEESEGNATQWDVLKNGFTGLAGTSKMKDWDRQQSEDEPRSGTIGGSDIDDEGSADSDGW